jgi:hypothetical protein
MKGSKSPKVEEEIGKGHYGRFKEPESGRRNRKRSLWKVHRARKWKKKSEKVTMEGS